MLGRFTRPDPNTKFSLFNPQSLNRYSYVVNNPVKFVDPTGTTLMLPGCGSGSTLTQCQYQQSLLQGALPAKARQHVGFGPGGRVVLKGIKSSDFAKQFGQLGRFLAQAIINPTEYRLVLGDKPAKPIDGTYTAIEGGVQTTHFNLLKPVTVRDGEESFTHRPDTALVHEFAHLIGATVFPGARDGAIERFVGAGNSYLFAWPEAFPLEIERAYRSEQGYEPRSFYAHAGDFRWPEE